MAGGTFDLSPRKLLIALNVLLAMRAGKFEFAHRLSSKGCCLRCNQSATEWTLYSRFKSNSTGARLVVMNIYVHDQLARDKPDPGKAILQTLRGRHERPG